MCSHVFQTNACSLEAQTWPQTGHWVRNMMTTSPVEFVHIAYIHAPLSWINPSIPGHSLMKLSFNCLNPPSLMGKNGFL